MSTLKASISISLLMQEGETQEAAEARLYDLLYEGLCCTADHQCDFWIESASEED